MDRKIKVGIISKASREQINLSNDKEIKKPNSKIRCSKGDIIFYIDEKSGESYGVDNHIYTQVRNVLETKNISNYALKLNKFTNIHNLYPISNNFEIERKRMNENIELIKNGLKDQLEWISFDGGIQDKLIIGLGGHSVFETDITLHHIYGIPFIPGQALKGILRIYIIKEYFNGDENKAMGNEDFLIIFGGMDKDNKNHKGKVIFFDSYPINNVVIKKDIMTPHHMKYYTGNQELPLDTDEPNPVEFLVIEETKFNFNLALDKDLLNRECNFNKDESKKYNIIEVIKDSIMQALKYYGIGAKTSVGYGYFDTIKTIGIR